MVEQRVLRLVDHKNLNLDVPEFDGAVPTTENLASFIERRLQEGWNLDGARLRGSGLSKRLETHLSWRSEAVRMT